MVSDSEELSEVNDSEEVYDDEDGSEEMCDQDEGEHSIGSNAISDWNNKVSLCGAF